MTNGFTIEQKLRPCLVGPSKIRALFHCWYHGTSSLEGVVELESGTICVVNVHRIQFIDNAHAEYSWPDDSNA